MIGTAEASRGELAHVTSRRPSRWNRRAFARAGLLVVYLVVLTAAGLAYAMFAKLEEFLGCTFEQPWFLLLLVILPFVLWRGTYGEDARTVRLRIGMVGPLRQGPTGLRVWLRDIPGVMRTVALGLLIVAMARPLNSLVPATSSDEGIDAVLVLDLSDSMRATVDNLPEDLERLAPRASRQVRPTRLDAAKAVMRDFVSRRKTDRIGVVVFGTAAYVVSPPTLDYHLLDALISKMQLGMIDGSGTAIGDAVGVGVARLKQSVAESKAVILLTDGDNNSGTLDPEYAAHLANVVDAKVYTIQIGAGEFAEVQHGFDLFGQPVYRRHRFPVNPELLSSIAESTGGASYIATDAVALRQSFHDVLDRLEKTKFEASVATFEDLYRFLLLPGVLLLGVDALLRSLILRRFP